MHVERRADEDIVSYPGTLTLRSRVARVYAGDVHRDIVVHEMTAGEVDWLKAQRVIFFLIGVLGSAVISTYVLYTNCAQ